MEKGLVWKESVQLQCPRNNVNELKDDDNNDYTEEVEEMKEERWKGKRKRRRRRKNPLCQLRQCREVIVERMVGNWLRQARDAENGNEFTASRRVMNCKMGLGNYFRP